MEAEERGDIERNKKETRFKMLISAINFASWPDACMWAATLNHYFSQPCSFIFLLVVQLNTANQIACLSIRLFCVKQSFCDWFN